MDFPLFTKRALCILLALIFCTCCVIRPVQVSASSVAAGYAAASVVGVPAALAIAAIVVACGVMVDVAVDSGAFDNLVSSISNSLDSAFSYVNDNGETFLKMLSINGYLYVDDVIASYVLDQILADDCISCSFSCDNVMLQNYANGVASTALSTYRYAYGMAATYPNQYYFFGNYSIVEEGKYTMAGSDTSPRIGVYAGVQTLYYEPLTCTGTIYPLTYTYSSAVAGIAVGDFAASLDDDKYKTWVQDPIISVDWGIQLEPDPEDPTEPSGPEFTPLYPLHIPSDPSEIPGYTQEDAQSFEPSVVVQEDTGIKIDLDLESVPDDLLDYIISTDSGSDSGGSGSDTGTDSGGSSSGGGDLSDFDPGKFTFSLKSFFPFCIPYDLHAMLSALRAEPETPVFTMGIPFGGQVYTFTIDLTAWNNIAAILRTCQVAIFCFGLTKLTQRVIKW